MRGALCWTAHRQRTHDLMLMGRTHREIAADLRIATGTARKHMEAVLHLTGASSRAQLQAREIERLRVELGRAA